MLYSILEYDFICFPVELLISEAIFLVRKPRREYFKMRLMGSIVLYFLLAYFWMTFTVQLPGVSLIPVILMYLGYAALTAIPILCSFEIQRLELLFVIAGGYAAQHMCFALLRIILYMVDHSLEVQGVLRVITQYLVYILLYLYLDLCKRTGYP